MRTVGYLAFGIAVLVFSAACGGRQVQVVGTGDERVTATATYREEAPLPPDAVLDVWIADVSPMPGGAAPVAQATVPMRDREIAFALRYDDERIAADRSYTLKAAVRSGGQTLYTTEADTLVITRGHSKSASLILRPVTPEPTESVAPPTTTPAAAPVP